MFAKQTGQYFYPIIKQEQLGLPALIKWDSFKNLIFWWSIATTLKNE